MTATHRSDRSAGNANLPSLGLTTDEQAIFNMASLTSWFDAESGLKPTGGFRWRDRKDGLVAAVLDKTRPLVVTGSHGKKALQMSYPTGFSGVDRGALRLPATKNLLAASGFSVMVAVRVPTVASGESATLGGYVWASRGPTGNVTPKLIISGTTGQANFSAGGAIITNPGFDLRSGNWHIIECVHDAAADTITVRIDGARAAQTTGGATTALDTSIIGMLAPNIGIFQQNDNSATRASPFYGQLSSLLTWNAALSSTDLLPARTYLAGRFGATLM